ncbi:MAG: NADH/ubiquinone/plastoquinone (complex I) [Planctomycetes bacterium]|nr:NADH/ubiquinone/plastoquinone (complex I) [Planctomycetota bacterium]
MGWLEFVLTCVVALPLVACLLLAVPAWFGVRFGERVISAMVGVAFGGAAAAALAALAGMLGSGRDSLEVTLGRWVVVGDYTFEWRLLADHLSVPFALFAAVLVGLIGVFSRRYLHRERGFFRFYLLLALFGAGVEIVVLAGALDQVFFGWELVGLTSALLIAFFHERAKPVEHGLRAFITYRVCDVGLLSAIVWLHHRVGSSRFVPDGGPWAGLVAPSDTASVVAVGLLLLWASMGKSAQVPLGGWLPRAMEGPTPSSAIFYGSISVHLGPYLLLRASPILQGSPGVAWAVVGVGALTAAHGSFVGRVQTDIKSLLAYASMTQVGLILVEIGFGLHYVPLIHICGHATIRSLEILRSPSLLHDHHHLEQAVGRQVPRTPFHIERLVPNAFRPWMYRHALERGYFDSLLRLVVHGFMRVMRGVDRIDRWWTGKVVGEPMRIDAGEEQRR